MTAGVLVEKCHVQVWFGEHVIANKWLETDLAGRYAEAMERRFPSLRVTVDPIPSPAIADREP